MKGYLKYRCRNCGEIVKIETKDLDGYLFAINHNAHISFFDLYMKHGCDEITVGICEFVGGEFGSAGDMKLFCDAIKYENHDDFKRCLKEGA